ncbi:MAG: hypothetical protein ACLRSW_08190 [Christensenellaceae bacterium]
MEGNRKAGGRRHDTADVILFLTDGREGHTPSDYDVADIPPQQKPEILVVNKSTNIPR